MEKIICPLFLFENINESNKLGGTMQGMYRTVEKLTLQLEAWQIQENSYRVYDATGKLLTLYTKWEKIKEKGLLFGTNFVNREIIKVVVDDNPIERADLLKKFLQLNLPETIIDLKKMLESHELSHTWELETGLFWKSRKKIINDNFSIVLPNNNKISIEFVFLKQLLLDYFNNILKTNAINNMELAELVTMASNLWTYTDDTIGTCVSNKL